METRRIEEHYYPVANVADLQTKVAELLADENLANFTVTKREDNNTFELTLQLKYPPPPEGRKT